MLRKKLLRDVPRRTADEWSIKPMLTVTAILRIVNVQTGSRNVILRCVFPFDVFGYETRIA
jgi:hypothetical protein